MIILNASQAEQVRGETAPGAALDPVPLADGQTFVLPEAVLTDRAHIRWHHLLETFPAREIAPSEWPQVED